MMKSDGLFDPIYGQLERVMDLRVEQHAMHTANLANVNTPNYRAKELDFSQVLAEVMEVPSAPLPMASTESGHLGGLRGVHADAPVNIAEPPPWALDGNSVNPDHEMVAMMENNLMFDTVARVTSRKLALLKAAISESR